MIRAARILAGLTQRELAQRARLHRDAVLRMEKVGARWSPFVGGYGALRLVLRALQESGVSLNPAGGVIIRR
jgi:transcriptional regulator with XRE-family HTH domain